MSADLPEARKPEDSVLESAEWRELAHLVAASLPERDAEAWLGRVVIEVQQASDRAVAWAENRAASVLAEARAEADRIRTQGQRRAQLMARFRAVAQRPEPKKGDLAVPRDADTTAKPSMARLRWPVVASPPTVAPLTTLPAANRRPQTPKAESAAGGGTTLDAQAAPPPPLAHGSPEEAVTPSTGTILTALAPPTGRPAAMPATVPKDSTDVVALATPATSGHSTAPPDQAVTGRPEPLGPKKPAYRSLAAVLLAIVVIAAGFIVFEEYGTKAQEAGAQQRLAGAFSTRAGVPNQGVLGLLTVPGLGLRNTAVVDGASRQKLQQGPAHDTSSQYPGQQGVVVIVGHHHFYGAPFGRLARLRVGDVVSLRTSSGLLIYRVTRNPQVLSSPGAPFVLPSATEVQASGGNPLHASQALVLATSEGTGTSPLMVVVATLDQSTIGLPPTSRANVSAVLRAIPGDRTGLLWAVLWILILVGCSRLTRLRHRRFPPVAVYAVAVAAAFLATYQLYGALDRLMPGTS